MTDPKPYVPEEGWAFYMLCSVLDDWDVMLTPYDKPMQAIHRRRLDPTTIVLARPPEPELIAVMLPREHVQSYADYGIDPVWQLACRAALAASPVSEDFPLCTTRWCDSYGKLVDSDHQHYNSNSPEAAEAASPASEREQ